MMINPGDVLNNRYRIESKIGQGGMSTVYRAVDEKLNRRVAVKVLKEEFSSDQEFVTKFNNEAKSVASLVHPSVVAAYDAVDEGGLHYIIMELVEGISLKEYIKNQGMLSNTETIGIAIKTAEGISAAHKRGIIHRDIKPQNIIVSNSGEIKVADFGIAKAVTGETISTAVLGSAHYISPEQAKSGTSDKRSDIYSLGITMYEMITGRLPFDGENTVSVVMAHINQAMVPPAVYNKEIYPALNDIIIKCTRKNPRERYQDADELIEDLKRCINNPEGRFVPFFEEERKPHPIENKAADAVPVIPENNPRKRSNPFALNKKLILSCVLIAALAIVCVLLSFFAKHRKEQREEEEAAVETEAVSSDIDIVIDADHTAPDLTGLTVEDAKKLLNGEKVALIVSAEEYNDVYLQGRIINQDPEEGMPLKEGDNLNVTVSLGSKLLSVVNSLKGITVEEAAQRLETVGIAVSGEVKQFSDDVAEDLVVGYILDEGSREEKTDEVQGNPSQGKSEEFTGEKLTEGSIVKLIVSAGRESEGAVIPLITGISVQEAEAVLKNNGLTLGAVTKTPIGDQRTELITEQSEEPGTYVKRGTRINVSVNSNPEEETRAAEDPYDYNEETELSPDFWYASIDESYQTGSSFGPSVENAYINIGIRLVQYVNDGFEYTVISESRPYSMGTRIPVSYRNLRGTAGVPQGTIELYDADTDAVLAAYELGFAPAGI